jgi:hypothetical protein
MGADAANGEAHSCNEKKLALLKHDAAVRKRALAACETKKSLKELYRFAECSSADIAKVPDTIPQLSQTDACTAALDGFVHYSGVE